MEESISETQAGKGFILITQHMTSVSKILKMEPFYKKNGSLLDSLKDSLLDQK